VTPLPAWLVDLDSKAVRLTKLGTVMDSVIRALAILMKWFSLRLKPVKVYWKSGKS
jgi:hypothetical protein